MVRGEGLSGGSLRGWRITDDQGTWWTRIRRKYVQCFPYRTVHPIEATVQDTEPWWSLVHRPYRYPTRPHWERHTCKYMSSRRRMFPPLARTSDHRPGMDEVVHRLLTVGDRVKNLAMFMMNGNEPQDQDRSRS
jgi:hypothetical protein